MILSPVIRVQVKTCPQLFLKDRYLFRVELDDQLLLDGQLDVFPARQLQNRSTERFRREVEPVRYTASARGVDRGLDLFVGSTLFLDRNDVSLRDAVGRDRDLLPAHGHVAVAHQLARLRTRRREPQRVHDVVQAAFELLEEVRSRDSLPALGALESQAERPLEKPVDPLDLLLLAKLDPVPQELAAPPAVLARRVVAPFDGALVLETAVPFQEQLHPFAPAEPTNRFG